MFKDRPKVVLHRYLGPGFGWGLSPSADTLPVFPLLLYYRDGTEGGWGGGFLLRCLPFFRHSAADRSLHKYNIYTKTDNGFDPSE